jgi:hypothetical protein
MHHAQVRRENMQANLESMLYIYAAIDRVRFNKARVVEALDAHFGKLDMYMETPCLMTSLEALVSIASHR